MNWTKLETAMMCHHLTRHIEYDKLVDYLCRTESTSSILASRKKVREYLVDNNMYDLTDDDIKKLRSPESPVSLEKTGFLHIINQSHHTDTTDK